MKKIDILRLAFKNFTRRKARSVLTILGVVIGTMAVVIMLSIGEGLRFSMEEQISQWGSITVITVYPTYSPTGQTPMNNDTLAAIKQIPDVKAIMPMKNGSVLITDKKKQAYASVIATDLSVLEQFDVKLSSGAYPQVGENESIVMGYMIPFDFSNPKKPNTEYIPAMNDEGKPNPLPFDPTQTELKLTFDTSYGQAGPQIPGKRPKFYPIKCVGVSAAKYDDSSYSVYMDYATYSKWEKEYSKSQEGNNNNGGNSGGATISMGGANMSFSMNGPNSSSQKKTLYNQLKVKVSDRDSVETVQKSIQDMGFQTYSSMESLNQVKQQSNLIQMVLGGIGAIAFVVAALGITNTMMMSTYERTREIGIMKVMGCRLRDIRDLFLTEAAIIGFLGGLVGLTFSIICSILLNTFSGGMASLFGLGSMGGDAKISLSIIPFWLHFAGIIFPTLVGLLSGFYPAQRAIKLSALEAIKNE